MHLIIMTSPVHVAGEAHILSQLLEHPVWRIHIRKPEWSMAETRALIEQLPSEVLPKISLHDHHKLTQDFPIGGIHLNHRNPTPLEGYKGLISRSCHTLEEIEEQKAICDYLFLSPIYDSISKEGLKSRFTPEILSNAARNGIIDHKTLALGGVTLEKLPEIELLGFGGAVILGEFWDSVRSHRLQEYLNLI